MKKIIITGGAGFIGSHLIEKLLNETDTPMIYIIDNLMRTNNLRNIQHLMDDMKTKARLRFINADIATFDYEAVIDPFQIDYIFHLASPRINRINEFNVEGHNTVAVGGFRLVDWAARYNNIKKLYFASSASVYYRPKTFPIYETDLKDPHTIYGAGKLYTEQIIKSYNMLYGLNYAISRFFSVYGPRMDNQGVYTEVVFNWLNEIKKGNNKVIVHGNPDEKILDLVYVDDVVNAVYDMTMSPNNSTYNVSTEKGTTLRGLVDIISKVTNTQIEIESVPEYRKDTEAKRIGSIDRLRAIGWEPTVSLEEGIERTWRWVNGK